MCGVGMCGSASYYHFWTNKIETTVFPQSIFPLVRALNLIRGNFELWQDEVSACSKLREVHENNLLSKTCLFIVMWGVRTENVGHTMVYLKRLSKERVLTLQFRARRGESAN
jgi:hypothetical protein